MDQRFIKTMEGLQGQEQVELSHQHQQGVPRFPHLHRPAHPCQGLGLAQEETHPKFYFLVRRPGQEGV